MMRQSVLSLVPVCAWLAIPATSVATIYTVRPDGSGDFPTIQAAIDAAESDDEIWLEHAAIDAVLQWEFKPATRNGIAASSRLRAPVRFSLD